MVLFLPLLFDYNIFLLLFLTALNIKIVKPINNEKLNKPRIQNTSISPTEYLGSG